MIIECPQCQEAHETDDASIPQGGMDFQCSHCGMTFRIKPHLDLVEQEEDTLLVANILLQREEIPVWMVQAYEQGERGSISDPHVPGDTILSHDIQMREANTEESIPILMDEAVHEEGAALDESILDAPYAKGKGISRDFPAHAPKAGRRPRPGLIISAILVLALAAFFLFGGNLRQKTFDLAENLATTVKGLLPFQESEEGSLQFSNLKDSFVPRGKKEPSVFVIEGKVTNRYTKPTHSIQVRGILFDEKGKRAAEEIVYCGNILKEKQIRTFTREKIEETLQNAYGDSLSNLNIEPGGSIPFMLVFFGPPGQLFEFSLEIANYTLKEQGD